MRTIYQQHFNSIFSAWGAHTPAFAWLSTYVVYGLFLSDFETLDVVETEMIVLACMLCQGLNGPSTWHLRGLRRLGIGSEDTEGMCEGVKMVVEWAGWGSSNVEGWPRVQDVEEVV
jgi:hypothetical protein